MGSEKRAFIELTPEALARLREPRALLGWALVVAGIVALIAGWFGVSGTLDPGKQLPYIESGGIGGVFLLGAGALLLVLNELGRARAETAELKEMIAELQQTLTASASAAGPHEPPAPRPTNGASRQRTRPRA